MLYLYMFIDLMSGGVFALLFAWIFLACCKDGSVKRFLLISLFTLYLCELFDRVGIPSVQYFRWNPLLSLIPFGGEKNFGFVLDLVLNTLLFLPFGFLLPILWKKCRSWKMTVASGFLLSLMVEILQMFCYRVTDVNDLLMNTLGTLLGYLFARGLFHKRWQADSTPGTGSVCDGVSLAVYTAIPLLIMMFLRNYVSDWIYRML